MSPKTGAAITPVAPTAPKAPAEADNSTAGNKTAAQADKSKKTNVVPQPKPYKPHKPPQTAEEKAVKTAWIEIELVDTEGRGVPGARYKVTLPDASVAEGSTDSHGKARVEGFEPGSCKVTFPDYDKEAWEPA